MTLILAGTIRLPPENVAAFRPHMIAMMAASRAEDGCLTYGYAEDVAEPGLIHVFEVWRDKTALEGHRRAPHMAAWRAIWPEFGVSDRRLTAYDVSDFRTI